MRPSALRPAVILVRPREEGNIGASARAMANMGLDELILVAPEAPIGREARAFAVGAGDILDRARTLPTLREAIAPFGRVVGTTSGRGREEDRPLLTARELPPRLAGQAAEAPTALVFGSERSGLNNDELALCGLLVRVPCAARQPTLNLAQAVLLLAYELAVFRDRGELSAAGGEPPAPSEEIDGLFGQLAPLLGEIGFDRDDTFDGVLRDLRRLAARAAPTGREVRILRGICRRASRRLESR